MGLPNAPNDKGPAEARSPEPAPTGHTPGPPGGWLRRNWWIVLLVAVAVIAIAAQAGILAKHGLQQAKARQQAEPVPGALGPFEWGYTFSDKNGAGQYPVKITVRAPVTDTDVTSAGSHSVYCDITVENASGSDMNVWADDFVLWYSQKEGLFSNLGPLYPVEGKVPTHLDAGQSATFTLHYLASDQSGTGCVTCGGPYGSSEDGRTWHDAYIQWGQRPIAP